MNVPDRHIPMTDSNGAPMPPSESDPVADRRDPSDTKDQRTAARFDQLTGQLANQKQEYRRLSEDFDSYIKRSQRDVGQQAAAQKEGFVRDLLPIIDNLERALVSGREDPDDPLFQGVRMTLQQLGQLLGQHGIEPATDRGRPFDPHRHEAVSVQCDPRQPEGIVLAVIQRGYWQGDKVFRPAKVIVNDLSRYSGVGYGR